ncbi:MAG TPA: DUF192 domain-containing protein [Candidatus Saccharimonadales bacterium]|nr:DUF192 domain-containing protein [Candidatus Saccharimonadales bacterium]
MTVLRTGGQIYYLRQATTATEQAQGLGGRHAMPLYSGMLFIFPTASEQCFWMKDMHFPLDMIWLNSAKQVVYMQAAISPNTYPETFCPESPARYVIELNTGQAHAAHIIVGRTLKF